MTNVTLNLNLEECTEELRNAILSTAKLKPEVFDEIVEKKSWQKYVAKNPYVQETQLRKIYNDGQCNDQLVQNSNLPEDMLEELLFNYMYRFTKHCAEVPSDVIVNMIEMNKCRIQEVWLDKIITDIELIEKGKSYIWTALAQCKNFQEKHINIILKQISEKKARSKEMCNFYNMLKQYEKKLSSDSITKIYSTFETKEVIENGRRRVSEKYENETHKKFWQTIIEKGYMFCIDSKEWNYDIFIIIIKMLVEREHSEAIYDILKLNNFEDQLCKKVEGLCRLYDVFEIWIEIEDLKREEDKVTS